MTQPIAKLVRPYLEAIRKHSQSDAADASTRIEQEANLALRIVDDAIKAGTPSKGKRT